MTFRTLPDQFTGASRAIGIHIGERIVKDDHTAAIRKQMVQHRKPKGKRHCFLCAFGQLAVVKKAVVAVNGHAQLVSLWKFGRNLAVGNDSEVMGKAVGNILHGMIVELFLLLLEHLRNMLPMSKEGFLFFKGSLCPFRILGRVSDDGFFVPFQPAYGKGFFLQARKAYLVLCP